MFGNLKSEGLEETQDRVGGYQPFETDIYTGTIKVAYATESAGGALGVVLILDLGGREHRETVWVSNKKKENWFLVKDKDGKVVKDANGKEKRAPLPGFTTVEDMCLITTGKPLEDQDIKEKVFKVYDPEAGAEVPKNVPALVDLIGQPISVSILKNLENKSQKDGAGNYVATAETRISNVIGTVFHPTEKMTVREAKNGKEGPQFWDAWLKNNQGKEFDKREIKDGATGQGGAPRSRGPSSPPQAGAGAPARKSLFGPKS